MSVDYPMGVEIFRNFNVCFRTILASDMSLLLIIFPANTVAEGTSLHQDRYESHQDRPVALLDLHCSIVLYRVVLYCV